MSLPERRVAPFGLTLPATLFVLVCLGLPVGYLALLSLNPPAQGEIELAEQFSLAGYQRLLLDSYYLRILLRTLAIAFSTTAICAVAGLVVAQALWRAPPSRKSLLVVLVMAPLLISIVARTYGWILILGDRGVINRALQALGVIDTPVQIMFTPVAVVIGLVHVCLPFMVLSILASLERIDASLAEAAATLGGQPWSIFRHVTFPLALPGVLAGATIVVSLSMSAYVTPALMGGTRADVLVTHIFQQFISLFDWRFGSVLVVFLLVSSFATLMLLLRLSARASRGRSA